MSDQILNPASQYTYPQSNTMYLPKAVEGISCPALLGVGTPITAGRIIARLKPVVTALDWQDGNTKTKAANMAVNAAEVER